VCESGILLVFEPFGCTFFFSDFDDPMVPKLATRLLLAFGFGAVIESLDAVGSTSNTVKTFPVPLLFNSSALVNQTPQCDFSLFLRMIFQREVVVFKRAHCAERPVLSFSPVLIRCGCVAPDLAVVVDCSPHPALHEPLSAHLFDLSPSSISPFSSIFAGLMF